MLVDDYDPSVERAYRMSPEFADSALFDAELAVKLEKRWIWRRRILGISALVLAFVFIRQFVSVRSNFTLNEDGLKAILRKGESSSTFDAFRDAVQSSGMADMAIGSVSGTQILVLMAVALALGLVALAVRLANSF